MTKHMTTLLMILLTVLFICGAFGSSVRVGYMLSVSLLSLIWKVISGPSTRPPLPSATTKQAQRRRTSAKGYSLSARP